MVGTEYIKRQILQEMRNDKAFMDAFIVQFAREIRQRVENDDVVEACNVILSELNYE